MTVNRQQNLDASVRHNCEAADSFCYPYGAHMLSYAAKTLAAMHKGVSEGMDPVSPNISMLRATTRGYLEQYDQWVNNLINGRVTRESKMYQTVVDDLKERYETSITANGKGNPE